MPAAPTEPMAAAPTPAAPAPAAANDPFATNAASAPKKEKMLFGKKLTPTTMALAIVLGVLILGGIGLAIFLVLNQ